MRKQTCDIEHQQMNKINDSTFIKNPYLATALFYQKEVSKPNNKKSTRFSLAFKVPSAILVIVANACIAYCYNQGSVFR